MDAESETQVLPRGPTPAPAQTPGPRKQTDRLVGRYELLHRLGHGGMATVYLGRARGKAGFEKRVAVKVIHPHLANEPDLVGMFLDEARIAADIHHPHVVETLDLGEDDGVYFMVMEFIEGETLSALMRAVASDREPLSVATALQVVADACEGLGAAHSLKDSTGRNRHLVHRDVSPQNLMITLDGWVKVADFGIMKAVGKTSHTRPGELRGKLAYMSPEQAHGREVDHRTDLFALGVIAWELCTGERLFAGDTDAATLEKVMRCEIPSVDISRCPAIVAGGSELADRLAAFFERALAVDPAERFQSATEMLTAIGELQPLAGPTTSTRQALAQRMQAKFGKRAEYLRAAMRDGTPLRSNTRKRSSMVEIAAAAQSVTAHVVSTTPVTDHTGDPGRAVTTTSTMVGSSARRWGLWLLLPMIGAGLAVAAMTFGRSDAAPPVEAPGAVASPPATAEVAEASQTVRWHFDTTPPGATIEIAGKLQEQTTPAAVSVPRGEDPVKVVLLKEGFQPTVAMLAPLSDQSFPYQLLPLKEDPLPVDSASPGGKKKRPKSTASKAGDEAPTPAAEATSGGPKFKPSPFPGKSSDQR